MIEDSTALAIAIDERNEARSKLHELRVMHASNAVTHCCAECGYRSPCRTLTVLEAL